jgi:hypothetical protein
MNVLVKPKVTTPWSKEMYDYNDEVARIMKHNIVESIVKYQNNFDKLNELMELCGGIKYGDGYTIDELYKDVHDEVDNVQNYWLAEEYPYSVSKGLVPEVMYEFVGYGK